ncbi:MAG: prolyl oligopeptidase family serine peptidase, partial [Lachnospiraceae bacterium]|nr:prolyl oligopeptidase family serine peptidase [Lachnospiraceae bacterium]
MPQLDAAYELLLQVLDEYSCDKDRVYMHGLSAGGYATFTLAQMYPETFAAIAPDASGMDPSKAEALKGMPIWIFQAADDPTVPVADNYDPTVEALDAAGVEYKASLYKKGEVFFPSAHFSWVPMYADEEFRDWMFEQKK